MDEEIFITILNEAIKYGLNGIEMRILMSLALEPLTAKELCRKLNRSTTSIYSWLLVLRYKGLIDGSGRPRIHYLKM